LGDIECHASTPLRRYTALLRRYTALLRRYTALLRLYAATMASTVFQKMSDAFIPEVLVEKVAQLVHRDSMTPVLKDITDYIGSPFERLILKKTPFAVVATEFAESVYIDDDYDWITVVFRRPNNAFIAYHYYKEMREYEIFLMEGVVSDDTIIITRFHNDSDRGIYTDAEAYYAEMYKNFIPFQELQSIFQLPNIHIKNDGQGRTWSNPTKIYDWFESYTRTFDTIARNMEDIGIRSNTPVLNQFIEI
jgi:hypothetical protein